MKLRELLKDVPCKVARGTTETEVGKICFDSREVENGDVFVAQRGAHVDGHAYIEKAVARGAAAVVCEEMPEEPAEGVTYVVTENSSEALGWMASRYYGEPSKEMRVVGVTGTNGKTTTATLLYEMAKLMGEKAGLLSTVCNYVGDEKVASSHTTPDALEINRLMRRMADEGCRYCFMEVSSHAADQRRVSGLDFDGAIFSNITHDHLDYHKTFRAYIEAKKGFFDRLPATAFALTNADDKNGMVMLQNTRARKYTYACHRMADFMCKVVEKHLDGMLLSLNGREVWVTFTGDFNADPSSTVIAHVLEDGTLRSAWDVAAVRHGAGWSFADFGQIPVGERPLIDYVFFGGGFEADECTILPDTLGGGYVSDHAPVRALLRYAE